MSDFVPEDERENENESAEYGTAHDEPVLVLDAATQEEADVARATLEAAGIPAILQNAGLSAGAGMVAETVDSGNWTNGVFVAPSDADEARAVLSAPAPSEEELIAEEEADPTTLAEAEARVKNA